MSIRARPDQRERALQKIADGTYGYSDRSGEPIPKLRLEAMPEATLTVEEELQVLDLSAIDALG